MKVQDYILLKDGSKICFEALGDGYPVIFIHGFSLDLRIWDSQISKLKPSYLCVRYDLRGFGKSDVPTRSYSHSADLYNILEYLKLEKVNLVGLSLGGSIAIDFSITYPERTNSLILVSSDLSGFTKKRIKGKPKEDISNLEEAQNLWLNSPIFVHTLKNTVAAEKLIRIVKDYSGWHWFNRDPVMKLNPPALSRLNELLCRTLLVIGEKDDIEFYEILNILRNGIKDTKVEIIENSGHLPNMENEERFNRVILDFLRNNQLGKKEYV